MTTTPTLRPIMTADELHRHKTDTHGRDYRLSDDGYGDMAVAAKQGWTAISSWGEDGWDLGDWPYVVISVKDADRFYLRQTVEGDTTVYAFDNAADQSAALDYLFVWYGMGRHYDDWAINGLTHDKREALDAGTLRVPMQFRGPYRDHPVNGYPVTRGQR